MNKNQRKQNNSGNLQQERIKEWEDQCSKVLKGKTIKYVRYQYTCEMKDMDWTGRALVIFFDDGSYMFPAVDPEGNGPGTLFTSFKNLEVMPSI